MHVNNDIRDTCRCVVYDMGIRVKYHNACRLSL